MSVIVFNMILIIIVLYVTKAILSIKIFNVNKLRILFLIVITTNL